MNEQIKKDFKVDMVSVRLKKDSELLSSEPLSSPEKVISIIRRFLNDFNRECVLVINCDNAAHPINASIISIGTVNQSFIEPSDIFRAAFLSNASSILIFHNHPSGNIKPSTSDIIVTQRLKEACKIMGINFLDHIIVGRNTTEYYSFTEKNILNDDQKNIIVAEENDYEHDDEFCL